MEWGMSVKKCSHTNYCIGRKPYSRRCTCCKYDESPTAGTIFDNIVLSMAKYEPDRVYEKTKQYVLYALFYKIR
jgi:hypothetical protein